MRKSSARLETHVEHGISVLVKLATQQVSPALATELQVSAVFPNRVGIPHTRDTSTDLVFNLFRSKRVSLEIPPITANTLDHLECPLWSKDPYDPPFQAVRAVADAIPCKGSTSVGSPSQDMRLAVTADMVRLGLGCHCFVLVLGKKANQTRSRCM